VYNSVVLVAFTMCAASATIEFQNFLFTLNRNPVRVK